jgi:hypothetical protein
MMDELLEYIEENYNVKFIVSLDYNEFDPSLYTCLEWGDLYSELGEFSNDPMILDGDEDLDGDGLPDHHIWNIFAGNTYSAYAIIDHNMILRYKFDMPNLYDFEYTYIPTLISAMYGCTDSNACNYNIESVYDDGSCNYGDECNLCEDVENQLDCMAVAGCMWMGDHCMESNDGCMDFDNELDCLNNEGCYWMGNHCMTGSNCTDPIAFNYNPIADILGEGDDSSCEDCCGINFGCTYEHAMNYNQSANVDDGSCEYMYGDINRDGIVNVLDIVGLVNNILGIGSEHGMAATKAKLEINENNLSIVSEDDRCIQGVEMTLSHDNAIEISLVFEFSSTSDISIALS